MSAKTGKRPLRSLTAHEKLDAIRRVHDGESKASVARDIGVPESTLRGWCKNEDKISYLSRQSSPDTDPESLEQQHQHAKRSRLEEAVAAPPAPPPPGQPFNLSLKATTFPEASEPRNNGLDAAVVKQKDTPKAAPTAAPSERERNRAELARLSVELGLNRPEMYIPAALNGATTNLADITANIGLLTQWNALLMQQQQQKTTSTSSSSPPTTTTTTAAPPKKITAAAADTSTPAVSSSTAGMLDHDKLKQLPKEKPPSVNESVWYWLRTQQSMLGLNGSPTTTTTTTSAPATTSATPSFAGITPDQSSWFWRWYKHFAYGQLQLQQQQQQQIDATKPILYQQLTKDAAPAATPPPSPPHQNAENLSLRDEKRQQQQKSPNKVRSVLDNLLFNNNNNNHMTTNNLSQAEAVEHGEKFLRWLEACSDPSVTAMQIMQFRSLLNNVKSGADRKNGDVQNKAKVKRK